MITKLFGTRYVALVLFLMVCEINLVADDLTSSERVLAQGVSMGVDVVLLLVDTKACERSVLPAVRAFRETFDTEPLVRLLRDALLQLGSLSREDGVSTTTAAVYEEQIAILSLPEANKSPIEVQQLREFVDSQVAPDLVAIYCFPHTLDLKPKQNMSRPALMYYLYSHSRWVEDYFTFAKEPSGPISEIKIGEWSKFLSQEEIQRFEAELSIIERPDDEQSMADGFDNLRAIVHEAATNADLSLLVAVM